MLKRLVAFLILTLVGSTASFAVSAAVLPVYRSAGPQEPTPYVDARVLAANTAETITVQTFTAHSGKAIVLVFSVEGVSASDAASFCLRSGGTADVPAADVTDGTSCTINPANQLVAQAATLSVESLAAVRITIRYYRAN